MKYDRRYKLTLKRADFNFIEGNNFYFTHNSTNIEVDVSDIDKSGFKLTLSSQVPLSIENITIDGITPNMVTFLGDSVVNIFHQLEYFQSYNIKIEKYSYSFTIDKPTIYITDPNLVTLSFYKGNDNNIIVRSSNEIDFHMIDFSVADLIIDRVEYISNSMISIYFREPTVDKYYYLIIRSNNYNLSHTSYRFVFNEDYQFEAKIMENSLVATYNNGARDGRLKLYNYLGQEISSFRVKEGTNIFSTKGLSSSVYFYRFIGKSRVDKGKILIKK
jgi:hypothetical protein